VLTSERGLDRDVGEEGDVSFLRHLALRWSTRNFSLVCPHCQHPASFPTFRRARFMLGDETLVCQHCRETSVVTFWRFEGLSCQPDRADEPPHHSRH
jgi:hypothetical protein